MNMKAPKTQAEIELFAAKFAAKCFRVYADELERLTRAAVDAWTEKQEPYPAGNTIRKEMRELIDFFNIADVEETDETDET